MANVQEAITQVKAAVDLAEYIQSAGVALDSKGATQFKGLCPFHADSNPSFTVDTHFQRYKCWACDASGDVLTFVQRYENLEFMEALRKLADANGIELDKSGDDERIDYRSLRKCIREAAHFYVTKFRALDRDSPAQRQITDRGLSLNGLTYGYAPEGRDALYKHLKAEGYSDEHIEAVGVAKSYEGKPFVDFWRGRLMFIIQDASGNPVGFSGRKLFEHDTRGKYVNSPDGPLFDKSSALFNLVKAKKAARTAGCVYVVEGQFDVAAFVEAGLENVVASSGTAFTRKQATMCSRMAGTNGKVIFAFDGDEAGVKAALKAFKAAPELQSHAYVVSFPEGTDPCDYLQHERAAAFASLLEKPVPLLTFVLDAIRSKYELEDEVARDAYVKEAASAIKVARAQTVRSAHIRKVALYGMVSADVVAEAVEEATPLVEFSGTELVYEDPTDRPVVESESDDELIERLRNRSFKLAARLSLLAMYEPRFRKGMASANFMPKSLKVLATELEELPPEATVLPERFTHAKFVEKMLSSELIPQVDELDAEARLELFKSLKRELVKAVTKAREAKKSAHIVDLLASADSKSSIELLRQAIAEDS